MLRIIKSKVFGGSNVKTNSQPTFLQNEDDAAIMNMATSPRGVSKHSQFDLHGKGVELTFPHHQVLNIDDVSSNSSGSNSLSSSPSLPLSSQNSDINNLSVPLVVSNTTVNVSKLFTNEYRSSAAATEYTIIRTINSGSTAKVQLAYHQKTDKHVALKIMAKSKHDLKYMNREVSIHKQLNELCRVQNLSHQHVAEIYEVIETPHHFVVVMEYLAGGDLFDLVPPNVGCSELQALTYLSQISTAVAHMHRSGVVHRDLKPENCVSDGKGVIKLVDYGAASETTGAMTSAGTIPYMAPEVFDKSNAPNWNLKAIDVWAIGVLYFTLLTGRFPWAMAAEDRSPEYRMYLDGDLCNKYPWNNFSEESKQIITSALHTDPAKRVTIEEFKASIDKQLYRMQYQTPMAAPMA
ncbi:serine/threonine protein kinase [Sphaeroforma arctica JP610]|uniref:Serine/threonine protein kinase n=1 Tax=Sphaeroforma arctica JP610 TaxID=667725 RepID=A0A0L0GEB0_9EUKA|nr:serine/threonine protein kinase [Sphaeroforma arctica JP610]KNC87355.1 serine/threonine protein kinase [Sphaeroforma arctica JP610]|eukprot:XP_014161257.1 serine/threonine protein kinase [Sphaeroforma arctica JP610]